MSTVLEVARDTLRAEERLLLLATGATQAGLVETLDVDRAIALARRNKVLPQLARVVRDWPKLNDLARWYRRAAHRRHAALLSILADFRDNDIPVAPLKGTVLSQFIYGDIAARQSSDIDLLVPVESFGAALSLLMDRGFRLARPTVMPSAAVWPLILKRYINYNVLLASPDGSIRIELHWRITHLGVFPGERNDKLWQRFATRSVGDLDVVSMDNADLLLYLAVHGTKDQWRRLLWLADFKILASRYPDDAAVARERAEESDLRVMWEAACRLSDRWYGTHLSITPQSRFIDQRARYIADHVSLLQPDTLKIPGGGRRYVWSSYDSRVASVRHVARQTFAARYYEVQIEADFNPALQLRRRIIRKVKVLLMPKVPRDP